MTLFIPPAHIRRVLRRLLDNGHAAYLVGGGVRNGILNRAVHDWDIATSAHTEDITKLFDKTVMTGAKYGTVSVILPECAVEITTFRIDGEYCDGRRPERVSFVGQLEDDLKRRDFTMNAIAMTENGEIIDPLYGFSDIKKKIIRCVGEPEKRFREDGLRMLRALRFSAELGFTIDSAALTAIRKLAGESTRLSAERVSGELCKTLISDKPEIAGDMVRLGLLAGRIRGGDAKNINSLVRLEKLPREILLRWCAFCAVLEQAGLIESSGEFTRKMRLDSKTVKICADTAKITSVGFPHDRAALKRLLAEYGIDAVRCAAASDFIMHGGNAPDRTDEIIRSGECFMLSQLAVTGRDLLKHGFSEGKKLGVTLNVLLRHVIEHPQDNSYDVLMRHAEKLSNAKSCRQ